MVAGPITLMVNDKFSPQPVLAEIECPCMAVVANSIKPTGDQFSHSLPLASRYSLSLTLTLLSTAAANNVQDVLNENVSQLYCELMTMVSNFTSSDDKLLCTHFKKMLCFPCLSLCFAC